MRELVLPCLTLVLLAGCAAPSAQPAAVDSSPPMDASKPAGAAQANPIPQAAANGTVAKPIAEVKVRFTGVYPALMTYEPKDVEVAAGTRVKLTFQNEDHNPLGKHNWKLKGTNAETKTIATGESDGVEFDAPAAGSYEYICSVPQHEGLGMKGNFIVKA